MGKLRKTLALGAIAGIVVPPIAAAIAKGRMLPVDDEEADEVALVTIFDGGRFTSHADAFRGGSALCWYGGVDVDLREARVDPAGARLQVTALFGGVRVIVPEDWQVHVRSTPLFGGVSDDTGGGRPGGPALELEVRAVFAGVQVTTRLAPDDELIPPPASQAAAASAGAMAETATADTAETEAATIPAEPEAGDGRGPAGDRAEVLARAEAEADAEAVKVAEVEPSEVIDEAEGMAESAAVAGDEPTPEPEASATVGEATEVEAPLLVEAPADESRQAEAEEA